MKTQLAIICASALLALVSLQLPVHADDVWFTKYDRNHDNHWDWQEFRKAHYDWYGHHHGERRMTDAELRAEFDRLAGPHHGWVDREQVRTWHQW